MSDIIVKKLSVFNSLMDNYKEGAPNTRYKSWEWCHKAFIEKRKEYKTNTDNIIKTKIIEDLALHLGFYLASWGMYRGTSYLLQRDYKAHKKTVKTILDADADLLWDYEPKEDNIELANRLLFDKEGVYWKIRESYKGYKEKDIDDDPSDTLVTKILLGTFGCIPAFDRYLKRGIKEITKVVKQIGGYKLTQTIIGASGEATTSFKALASFAIQKEKSFRSGVKEYPLMKLVDMFLWELGYEIEIASEINVKGDSNKPLDKLIQKAKELRMLEEDCDENKAVKKMKNYGNGIGQEVKELLKNDEEC